MGRPREHDEQTRDRILEKATELLATRGPEGVTVRRVADGAGTTTRAIYSLFGDKRGLLQALHHEAAALMTATHLEVAARDDVVAEMVDLGLAYRRAALANPHTFRLLMGDAPDFRPDPDDVRLGRRSFARVVEALGRLAAAGRLGGRTVERAGTQMWALVHGLATLELMGLLDAHSDPEALWRDAVQTMVQGLSHAPDHSDD
jgi:AcrR family transcriptional regulator